MKCKLCLRADLNLFKPGILLAYSPSTQSRFDIAQLTERCLFASCSIGIIANAYFYFNYKWEWLHIRLK